MHFLLSRKRCPVLRVLQFKFDEYPNFPGIKIKIKWKATFVMKKKECGLIKLINELSESILSYQFLSSLDGVSSSLATHTTNKHVCSAAFAWNLIKINRVNEK